jgi:hypothetical protein
MQHIRHLNTLYTSNSTPFNKKRPLDLCMNPEAHAPNFGTGYRSRLGANDQPGGAATTQNNGLAHAGNHGGGI